MALIVTIIVLLILAGVSIATLAGNNGLLSRTTIAKEATRAGEVKELVRLEAQANKIAETTNDTQKTRSAVIAELVADEKLTSAEAEEIQSAETPTITIGGITIDFSILPEAQITTQWALEEGDTSLSVGDLLTPTVTGLENEKFYVIGIDGEGENQTVRLLSQYCLNTTNNEQDENMGISNGAQNWTELFTTGAVAFSVSDTEIYANSSIKTLVESYANKLVLGGLILQDIEITEGGEPVSGVKGRLMWGTVSNGEVQEVITANSNMVFRPDGENSLQYWLGSRHAFISSNFYTVSNGAVSYYGNTNDKYYAVRPVIKILASKIAQ